MNKAQRRKEALERHDATLEKLSEFLGKKQDGKKLSLKLWKLEQKAHKAARDYCNGDRFTDENSWYEFSNEIKTEIEILFGGEVPGLFVNGDARGYALKIDDKAEREIYRPSGVNLYRDWGGYGILSPEIE